MTDYKLGIARMLQKGSAYQQEGSQVVLVSPPDELCFAKALMHLAYAQRHISEADCHSAYSQAACV